MLLPCFSLFVAFIEASPLLPIEIKNAQKILSQETYSECTLVFVNVFKNDTNSNFLLDKNIEISRMLFVLDLVRLKRENPLIGSR